jgi:hypothetical protein
MSAQQSDALFFQFRKGGRQNSTGNDDPRLVHVRETYCNGCPVKVDCYGWAMKTQSIGIWGGQWIILGSDLSWRLRQWKRHGQNTESAMEALENGTDRRPSPGRPKKEAA